VQSKSNIYPTGTQNPSKEVGQNVFEMDTFHGFRNSLEYFKLLLSILLDLHDSCQVVAPVAVVGSAPDSNQVLVLKNNPKKYLKPMNVAFLDKLMGSCDQLDSVDLAEIVCNFGSENPAGTSGVDGPVLDVFGVRPH
jgi:hypothetical protein